MTVYSTPDKPPPKALGYGYYTLGCGFALLPKVIFVVVQENSIKAIKWFNRSNQNYLIRPKL